jgi:hypothetical protein
MPALAASTCLAWPAHMLLKLFPCHAALTVCGGGYSLSLLIAMRVQSKHGLTLPGVLMTREGKAVAAQCPELVRLTNLCLRARPEDRASALEVGQVSCHSNVLSCPNNSCVT